MRDASSSTTQITNPAPVTPGAGRSTEGPACGEIVCETEERTYQINASLCRGWSTLFNVLPSPPNSTVSIWIDKGEKRRSFLCVWRISAPKGWMTTARHAYPLLFFLVRKGHDVKATKTRPGQKIGQSLLKARLLSLYWFEQTYVFSYCGTRPILWFSKTLLRLSTEKPSQLPSGALTDTAFFVTSPNFGASVYPDNYYGEFIIDVPDLFSALIKVTQFHLQDLTNCRTCYKGSCHDEFVLIELDQGTTTSGRTWSGCGSLFVPLQILRNSVVMQFSSDDRYASTGFNLSYAVIPADDDLTQHEGELNCSSSFFSQVEVLFRCDLILECQDSEDEADCDMHGDACGAGGVELGQKCVYVYSTTRDVTWHEAQIECSKRTQHLVTFTTSEYGETLRWMKSKLNILRFFVGLQLTKKHFSVPLSILYKDIWQWTDGRTAFVAVASDGDVQHIPICAYFTEGAIRAHPCDESSNVRLLCEIDKPSRTIASPPVFQNSSVEMFHGVISNLSLACCPLGHFTRDFLSCNGQNQYVSNTVQMSHHPDEHLLMFTCDYGATVPYSLLCDYISHCKDSSDEDFCQFRPCPVNLFRCSNSQCVENKQVCDNKLDCFDRSDEDTCNLPNNYVSRKIILPAIFRLDGKGAFTANQSNICPPTHFRCPHGYCFPVYLRCNDVDDCPGREDEAACNSHTCVGFYRCRESAVCLHVGHVCDGVSQCPQYDDELLCEKRACPDACHCQGWAFVCKGPFGVGIHSEIRYLDISGTSMTSERLEQHWYLITLLLSDTGLTEVPKLALPNLRYLDLSYNEINHCNMQLLRFLKNLRVLILKENPLQEILNNMLSTADLKELQNVYFSFQYFEFLGDLPLSKIDLSYTHLKHYDASKFTFAPHLKTLNLSWTSVHTITESGFRSSRRLEVIDVRGSALKNFPKDVLRSMPFLQNVFANSFKLCCAAMLPEDFNANNCHADEDALASCEDLLRSHMYRAFMWMFLFLSLVGNGGSFVARLYLGSTETSTSSFGVFVTHLCVSDFFMGVYLLIIGAADLFYLGEYLWYDDQWKLSPVCKLAGFVSFMSSEVSAFIICLITIDRLIVLSFPFSMCRFGQRSSLAACLLIWTTGISLASFPLLPVASHWNYYSQTSICIPLPFATGDQFEGRLYSMGVMIIINFVLFLLIALGQVLIYRSVQRNSMPSLKYQGSKDVIIARRLMTVVVSDFLCWFPVGLLGLLSSAGVSIARELNVGVAVFVLPFNSAMNPFLYTLNLLMEKRQKRQEDRLIKRLQAQK